MPSPNPTGQPNPQTATTTKRYTYGELKRLWIDAGGPAGKANVAAAIALAESNGNPNARNSIGATGLWQIYNGPGTDPGLKDPVANARAAVAKYNTSLHARGDGFLPWTTYTGADTPGHRKTYKDYLNLNDDKTAGAANQSGFADGVDSAGNTVRDTVSSGADALASVGTFLASLVNPATWLHVLEVVGGVILLVMGLRVLTGSPVLPKAVPVPV